MAAAVTHCISSCLGLPYKFKALSLSNPTTTANTATKPLSFSANTSLSLFSKGLVSISPLQRVPRHSIVCEAATTKKASIAAKRARQAQKRRTYNRGRKSEIRTRMKKMLIVWEKKIIMRLGKKSLDQNISALSVLRIMTLLVCVVTLMNSIMKLRMGYSFFVKVFLHSFHIAMEVYFLEICK